MNHYKIKLRLIQLFALLDHKHCPSDLNLLIQRTEYLFRTEGPSSLNYDRRVIVNPFLTNIGKAKK